MVIGRQRLAPFFAAPAEFKRGILQLVDFIFFNAGESGLQRGKPVVVPPVKGDGAERAAGEFGQRVVRDGFTAVQEKNGTP